MSNGTDISIGQSFQHAMEVESRKKQVVFEYAERANERLRIESEKGIPYIVANRAGLLALAKLLITIGAAYRSEGFDLHLRQDFDGAQPEVLRIRLEDKKVDAIAPPAKAEDVA